MLVITPPMGSVWKLNDLFRIQEEWIRQAQKTNLVASAKLLAILLACRVWRTRLSSTKQLVFVDSEPAKLAVSLDQLRVWRAAISSMPFQPKSQEPRPGPGIHVSQQKVTRLMSHLATLAGWMDDVGAGLSPQLSLNLILPLTKMAVHCDFGSYEYLAA
eukprot:1028129-Amphidinium_carterae.1